MLCGTSWAFTSRLDTTRCVLRHFTPCTTVDATSGRQTVDCVATTDEEGVVMGAGGSITNGETTAPMNEMALLRMYNREKHNEEALYEELLRAHPTQEWLRVNSTPSPRVPPVSLAKGYPVCCCFERVTTCDVQHDGYSAVLRSAPSTSAIGISLGENHGYSEVGEA